MLGLQGSKKVGNIPNEIFPLVIIATVRNFDVSNILIDGGNSYNIIYSELLERIRVDRNGLLPYEDPDLQAFSETTTCPWGYIELMIYAGDGRDIRIVSIRFLVILCRSVYNCILGQPFAAILIVVALSVYLKMKFHNLHGESDTISVNLEGVKRIYQDLQKDREEGATMEINIASIPGQLNRMRFVL